MKSDKKKTTPTSSATSTTTTTIGSKNKEVVVVDMKKKLRIKLVTLGKEVVLLQRQRSPMKKVKRQNHHQFGEVEQAACLLMSLSYAPVSC